MWQRIIHAGVFGGEDVAQIVHLPTFVSLSRLFKVKIICDISLKTATHCANRFGIPRPTTDPTEVFNDSEIDAVVVITSDEFHGPYAIAALQAGKHVFVEKPMTLSLEVAKEIIDAEFSAPNGARVFVGYMRRYAPDLNAFKHEVASVDCIKFDDIPAEAEKYRKEKLQALLGQAWGIPSADLSPEQMNYCCLLANLGSHGLSLMREVLGGLPSEVLASTDNARWYTTMFEYQNKSNDERFTCLYETGINFVPRFDSQVAIFGENKSVSINYDTPFVGGLGITVKIDELNEYGEKSHRSLQTSYEDAYSAELREWYDCIVNGKAIKTTCSDAVEDLKLFKMMMDKYPAYKRAKGSCGSDEFLPSGP
ncbi:uncharacterized protein N7483_013082 [Penicillium malachiteum]|uniref:uncharacterized protein n=1 Tax=Penicillium malachiteum TaxID=1324776 RepID=UPI002546E6E6|nr:uncharacterized protein N7483_013082 [Penicillium malachiteum]KAJ5715901.1 hypothetical protein N7483_013082 [Penicillium malachiteum]